MVCIHFQCCSALAGDFMLDGFRGIKWEDGPSALGNNKIIFVENSHEITYMKKDDSMSFYGIKTGQPLYVFSKNGFIYAYARFFGLEKYVNFLKVLNDNGIYPTDMSQDVLGNAIAGTNLAYVRMHIVETRRTGISLEFFSDHSGTITVYKK